MKQTATKKHTAMHAKLKQYGALLGLFAGIHLSPLSARAQAPGSESIYGGSSSVKSILTGGTSADISESIYIGPGTHIIDGTWEIYAQRVVIDPAAIITGTGSIQIYNPGDLVSIYPPAVSTTTLIDGNTPLTGTANNIDVNIEHFNNAGIQLSNITFPSDLISDGWTDVSNSSTVYIGKDINLSVDGADVILGTGVIGDLRFDNDATISNFRPARMVITNNSILSHVVKENYSGDFVFPVGISDGDYTPAAISNATANTVRVSVQDYMASVSPEATTDPGPGGIAADGMNRTWHIYADNAGISSGINLQHNGVTNQSGFNDLTHYVTQWGSTSPNTTGDNNVPFGMSSWQTNTPGAGVTGTLISPTASLSGSSMRSRTYGSLATSESANETYFTKSADPFHPLPVTLIRFDTRAIDCDVELNWEVAEEGVLKHYQIMHSTDGIQYETLRVVEPQGKNSKYHYLHQNPGKGTHIYRLMMTGVNEERSYSGNKQVQLNCKDENTASLLVYPNPANDILVVDGMDTKNEYTIRIITMEGKLVAETHTNNAKAEISISHLAAAPYILQCISQNQVLCNITISKL